MFLRIFGMSKPKNWQRSQLEVLITKRKDERWWEIGSWRSTSLVACTAEMATAMCLGCMMLHTRWLFPLC